MNYATTTATYAQVIETIEKGKLTPEQLWNIQVTAAAVSLEDGVGTRWVIDLPQINCVFNEDTITAAEMREVAERTGATMLQMGFDGLVSDGRLIFEFVRARLIYTHNYDAADAEALVGHLPMVALVEAVRMEPVNPDPKGHSGTMYPNVRFGVQSETVPSDDQGTLFSESDESSTSGGPSTT